jgi:hypothetical protein
MEYPLSHSFSLSLTDIHSLFVNKRSSSPHINTYIHVHIYTKCTCICLSYICMFVMYIYMFVNKRSSSPTRSTFIAFALNKPSHPPPHFDTGRGEARVLPSLDEGHDVMHYVHVFKPAWGRAEFATAAPGKSLKRCGTVYQYCQRGGPFQGPKGHGYGC